MLKVESSYRSWNSQILWYWNKIYKNNVSCQGILFNNSGMHVLCNEYKCFYSHWDVHLYAWKKKTVKTSMPPPSYPCIRYKNIFPRYFIVLSLLVYHPNKITLLYERALSSNERQIRFLGPGCIAPSTDGCVSCIYIKMSSKSDIYKSLVFLYTTTSVGR